MRVLVGQSAEESLFQLVYEMANLSDSKAERQTPETPQLIP